MPFQSSSLPSSPRVLCPRIARSIRLARSALVGLTVLARSGCILPLSLPTLLDPLPAASIRYVDTIRYNNPLEFFFIFLLDQSMASPVVVDLASYRDLRLDPVRAGEVAWDAILGSPACSFVVASRLRHVRGALAALLAEEIQARSPEYGPVVEALRPGHHRWLPQVGTFDPPPAAAPASAWSAASSHCDAEVILFGDLTTVDDVRQFSSLEAYGSQVTLAAVPVYGHAKAVSWLLGHAGYVVSAPGHRVTVAAVQAPMACPACSIPWHDAKEIPGRISGAVRDRVAALVGADECASLRIADPSPSCATCHGQPTSTVVHSELPWTWELEELVRRDGGDQLDLDLVRERIGWDSTGDRMLEQVRAGVLCATVLSRPALETEFASAQPTLAWFNEAVEFLGGSEDDPDPDP